MSKLRLLSLVLGEVVICLEPRCQQASVPSAFLWAIAKRPYLDPNTYQLYTIQNTGARRKTRGSVEQVEIFLAMDHPERPTPLD